MTEDYRRYLDNLLDKEIEEILKDYESVELTTGVS